MGRRAVLLVAALLCAAGCKGTIGMPAGGDADPGEAPIAILSLGVSGTTTDDCAVEVAGQPDNDGIADKGFTASFDLDGGSGAGSLPVDDPGARAQHRFDVKATRSSDGAVLYKRVTATVYEAD